MAVSHMIWSKPLYQIKESKREMTAITYTYTYYCKFCEAVAKVFKKFIGITETIGYARAAAELARMGYQEEAKALMMQIKGGR